MVYSQTLRDYAQRRKAKFNYHNFQQSEFSHAFAYIESVEPNKSLDDQKNLADELIKQKWREAISEMNTRCYQTTYHLMKVSRRLGKIGMVGTVGTVIISLIYLEANKSPDILVWPAAAAIASGLTGVVFEGVNNSRKKYVEDRSQRLVRQSFLTQENAEGHRPTYKSAQEKLHKHINQARNDT